MASGDRGLVSVEKVLNFAEPPFPLLRNRSEVYFIGGLHVVIGTLYLGLEVTSAEGHLPSVLKAWVRVPARELEERQHIQTLG